MVERNEGSDIDGLSREAVAAVLQKGVPDLSTLEESVVRMRHGLSLAPDADIRFTDQELIGHGHPESATIVDGLEQGVVATGVQAGKFILDADHPDEEGKKPIRLVDPEGVQ